MTANGGHNWGTGIFTQSGGTHTIGQALTVGGIGASAGLAYNLNGGLFSTPIIAVGVGTTTSNFSGGTLGANANTISFL